MRFYHIVEGDPLDNSPNSQAVEGLHESTIEGPDGRSRPQVYLNHRAYCGVCKRMGPVVMGPHTPGFALRLHDRTMNAHEAVEGDVVACGCQPPPRLVARNGRLSCIDDMSQTAVSSAPQVRAPTLPSIDQRMAQAAYGDPKDWTAQVGDPAAGTLRAVVLRIGVFFDGTGNNAGNTDLARQCRASTADAQGQDKAMQQAIVAHCQPYMTESDGSYGNGVTNVRRLYDLYQDSTNAPLGSDARDCFIRIYVPGIGTTTGEPDDILGMGLGTGETGILARVAQALDQAIPRQMHLLAGSNPNTVIEAIEFDVFGFSRGAAAARHFVNAVHAQGRTTLLPALRAGGARLIRDFEAGRDLRVGFVGLFDTVVSRGSLADGLDVRRGHNGPVKVALAAGCARRVVQLVARDECRANFMLTTVQPEHHEVAVPGAHSDVGGSYHTKTEGPMMLVKPQRSVEPLNPRNAHGLPDPITTGAWRHADAYRSYWRHRLGDIDERAVTVDAWQRLEVVPPAHGSVHEQRQAATYATLKLERPIDWRYQLVPLRIMHALAKEAGVAWRQSPDEVPGLELPGELYPLVDRLLDGRPLDAIQEAMLARDYLHRSAHWNPMAGHGHALIEGPLYINRPDPSGHRVVLPNEDH